MISCVCVCVCVCVCDSDIEVGRERGLAKVCVWLNTVRVASAEERADGGDGAKR